MLKIKNTQVADVFKEYPSAFRKKLEHIRTLILQVTEANPDIGELEETLKWGEPSYLPKRKNIGTTVRIHWLKSKPHQCGVYFNCQTTLILKFKKKYPDTFQFEGKRAIIFCENTDVPVKELKDCILMALTYHLGKKKRR